VFLLEYSAATDSLAVDLEHAIRALDGKGGATEVVNNSPVVANDSSAAADESSSKFSVDELDADHDNLAFVGRQLEEMAAGYDQSTASGPPLAVQTRFYVEKQGGRSVTSLLEKMFIKELHHSETS